ncbi:hypothetical protein EC991_003413 [Linnemannia zychae]|nr:hypothetical protein EC991_003413 [Linnemannia zychae]
MSPHALDLPEIVSLVGSFLPIWVVDHPSNKDHQTYLFKPAPLCQCLRVSRLWYDALLPILWHGYWSRNRTMTIIPPEAFGRYCRLLKTLQLHSKDLPRLESALHGCTNLINLNIGFSRDRLYTGKAGLIEIQLLRSNPLLKRLSWTGDTPNYLRLSPQDFVGLQNLEILYLCYWGCSGRVLIGILRAVAETLKELTIGSITGVRPGDFTSSRLQDSVGRPGKDSGAVKTEHDAIKMGRLEKLCWGCKYSSFDCIAELVKFCPNLKTLQLSPDRRVNLDGLAESLQIHCPHLETVIIKLSLSSDSFWSFSRRCSTSGLRTIYITSRMPENDLISGILHHGSTLEDLRVFRRTKGIGGMAFFSLLVECTKLKRFGFESNFSCFTSNPLEAWKQEKWGCRGLEELDLHFDFLESQRLLTEKSEQEFRGMTFAAGWEMVPLPFRYQMFDMTHLPKVFELLEFQELKKLQLLVLSGIVFRRIPS